MCRLMPLFGLVLLLAGCAGEESPAAQNPLPPDPVTMQFTTADEVKVSILDREPAEQVELVGPDGRVYAASQITRDQLVERFGGTADFA